MREGDLTYDDFLQRLNIQDVLIDGATACAIPRMSVWTARDGVSVATSSS